MAEKYSKWRDASTGIPPFLPAKKLRGHLTTLQVVATTVKDHVLGPVVSVVKLAIIAVLALIGSTLGALGNVLIVPQLRRWWSLGINFVFCRLSLVLLGFYWIKTSYVTLKKGLRERQELQKKSKNITRSIRPGDVIVSNHSSYVDILYFQTWYAPQFIQVSRTGKVRPIQLSEALFTVGEYPELDKGTQDLTEVVERARRQLRPVVVFPEATTSNGRGLLKFMPVLDRLDVSEGKCRIHIFGIKYDFEEFAPTYTIGGKLNHLIGLGAQFVNTMEVKILEPQEAAVLGEKQEGGKEESMGSRVAALMGQMTRLRMTNLSVVDKQAFFNFYMEKENKKRK